MTNYWRLLATWYRLKSFQYRNNEEIRHYQLGRFKKLVQHAYQRVPMYREFYDSHHFSPLSIRDYDDVEKVPVMTKDLIRNFPIEKRVDPRVSKRNIHKETTSGSTGEPIEIWTDQTASLIQVLKGIRLLHEWGFSALDNTVQLWRGGVELKKSLIQKLGLFKRQLISMMDEPDIVVDALRRSRCDILFATRSALEMIAEELKKRDVKVSPRILVSCSEVLTDKQRQFLRQTFGCNTLEIYGCVEAGNIAWGCPTNPHNLHIDIETVMVNFRDIESTSNGSNVGSIIVTNLENKVMPFIRYDLASRE